MIVVDSVFLFLCEYVLCVCVCRLPHREWFPAHFNITIKVNVFLIAAELSSDSYRPQLSINHLQNN